MGNIITKYPVKKIILKTKGVSTLAGRKIWYDDILKRLNADGRGKYLGEFDGDDRILTVLSNGVYELSSFDLNNHFDDKMVLIEKYDPQAVFSIVHIEGKSKNYLVKRFSFENIAIGKQVGLISEEAGSKMVLLGHAAPVINMTHLKGKDQTAETLELNLADVIDVKGMKAMGNRLSQHPIKSVELISDGINQETEAAETNTNEEDTLTSTDSNEDEPVASQKESSDEPTEQLEEPPKPPKKIDFEITNPDDIDIDDQGQLGLF